MHSKDFDEARVLVIGTGSIGERHIANLQGIGVKDLAILTRSVGKSGRRTDLSLIPQFESANSALSTFSPTHVVVCSPSGNHVDEILFWAPHVLSVLVEIPLVCSVLEYNKVDADLRKKIYSGFNIRFHPIYRRLRQEIDSRGLEPLRVRAQFGECILNQHTWEDAKGRYELNSKMGGGALLTSCHELDLVCDLLGPIAGVTGMFGRLMLKDIDCEDSATILCRHENGGFSEVHLNLWQPTYERDFLVVTRESTFSWDFVRNILCIKDGSRQEEEIIYSLRNYDFNETYIDEMKDFLRGKDAVLADFFEFKNVIEMIESVKNKGHHLE